MSEWLSKSEVNAHYYATVAGDISFQTEASVGFHPTAVAKLIAARSRSLGLRRARILEIGANDCSFARAVLGELRLLRELEDCDLERVDYVAVEQARESLERAAEIEEQLGGDRRILRPAGTSAPAGPEMVALVMVDDGGLIVNLGLVNAEANRFVESNAQSFDFAILNELLDDMPYRAYFADAAGRAFEVVPLSREQDGGWTIRIEANERADGTQPSLPPGTMTARSEECVRLVTGIAGALVSGGMLLVHDYGFAEPLIGTSTYETLPPSVPPFAAMEYPEGSEQGLPRSFFRVFGNEANRVVQVTNDVNFAELTEALRTTGTVFTLPHGSQVVNAGVPLERGQGVFLSEFGLLEAGDDLDAQLLRLRRDQVRLRDDYAREYVSGWRSIFLDLVYIRS